MLNIRLSGHIIRYGQKPILFLCNDLKRLPDIISDLLINIPLSLIFFKQFYQLHNDILSNQAIPVVNALFLPGQVNRSKHDQCDLIGNFNYVRWL